MSKIIFKKYSLFILGILLLVPIFVFSFLPTKKLSFNKNQIFTNNIENNYINLDLDQMKKQIKSNNKWILFIHDSWCHDCKDFKEHIAPTIFKKFPKLQLFTIDYAKYNDKKRIKEWNEIIGKKDINGKIKSSNIENFIFSYTPTVALIINNKLVEKWDSFGGGKDYKDRYYRNNESKKNTGFKIAISDFEKLIKKWNQ